MKYKSFDLTNFIGLEYFSPKSIAELKGENEKYEQSQKSKPLNLTQTKVTTMQVRCAKCKKSCSKKSENCVYSYSTKKKDYKKFFLCEDCSLKCRKCNKISKTGIFVYIWNKSKGDYSKLFYCIDCYKKANLKQCASCKKRVDSEVVIGGKSFCKGCHKISVLSKSSPKSNSNLLKIEKQLQNIDINKLSGNETRKYIEDSKTFFKIKLSELKNDDPLSDPLASLINILDDSKKLNPEEIGTDSALIQRISIVAQKIYKAKKEMS